MLAIGAFQNEAHASEDASDIIMVDSVMVITVSQDFTVGPWAGTNGQEADWVAGCLDPGLGGQATVTTNTPIPAPGISCFQILSPDPFDYRYEIEGGIAVRYIDFHYGDTVTIQFLQ